MEFYAEYVKDRKGAELVVTNCGFYVYSIHDEGKTFFIEECFVTKNKRRSREASREFNNILELAKDLGCVRMEGTVCTRSLNYMESFSFIKSLGFEVDRTEFTSIFLVKEL